MKAAFASIILFASAPVSAQTLWKNVQAGMTATQIHSLYPEVKDRVKWRSGSTEVKGAVQVGSCKPKVTIHHDRGVVERVDTGMAVLGLKATCTDEAYQLMLATYGAPMNEVQSDKTSIGGTKYKNVVSTWIKDGVAITMDRDTGYHDDMWRVTYKPAAQSSGL